MYVLQDTDDDKGRWVSGVPEGTNWPRFSIDILLASRKQGQCLVCVLSLPLSSRNGQYREKGKPWSNGVPPDGRRNPAV